MKWRPFEDHEGEIEIAKEGRIARGPLENFRDYIGLRYNKHTGREIPSRKLHSLIEIEIFGSQINGGLLRYVLEDSSRYSNSIRDVWKVEVFFRGSDKRKQPVLVEDYDIHYLICPYYTKYPPIESRYNWRQFYYRYFEEESEPEEMIVW